MSVVLLRLVGPMQSWGIQSHFDVRDAGREPSKSGVVGLVACALGRSRAEPIDDLAGLRMGVRVDCEGTVEVDFQVAQGVLKAAGRGLKSTEISHRYYLSDAKFLVGLESENLALLQQISDSLRRPRWLLCLGRKAFPPGEPIWLPDGLQTHNGLMQVFEEYPWLGRDVRQYPDQVRVVLDDPEGAEVRPDVPMSCFEERRFAPRRVSTRFIPTPPLRTQEGQDVSLETAA